MARRISARSITAMPRRPAGGAQRQVGFQQQRQRLLQSAQAPALRLPPHRVAARAEHRGRAGQARGRPARIGGGGVQGAEMPQRLDADRDRQHALPLQPPHQRADARRCALGATASIRSSTSASMRGGGQARDLGGGQRRGVAPACRARSFPASGGNRRGPARGASAVRSVIAARSMPRRPALASAASISSRLGGSS